MTLRLVRMGGLAVAALLLVLCAGSPLLPRGASAATTPSSYVALAPCRILDTRDAAGVTGGAPVSAGNALSVGVTGSFACASVPSNATAVVLNGTITAPTFAGFLAVFAAGTPSSTSNINFAPGQTVANLITTAVGSGGEVTLSVGGHGGSVHAILDLEGYYAPPGGSTAGQYVPLAPARIADTRRDSGCPYAGDTLGPGGRLTIDMHATPTCSGASSGLPSAGASAVVMNLTETDAAGAAASYLTAWPSGIVMPATSNLNFVAGDTRANRAIVGVSSESQVSVFNAQGTVDVIVDVEGYYTDSTAPAHAGSLFVGSVPPQRLLDTRTGGPLGPGQTLTLPVTGHAGVPTSATAVVENATAAGPSEGSFLTIFPGGTPRPLASDVNFTVNEIATNMVQVGLGAGGESIFNDAGSVYPIVDLLGYFTPA